VARVTSSRIIPHRATFQGGVARPSSAPPGGGARPTIGGPSSARRTGARRTIGGPSLARPTIGGPSSARRIGARPSTHPSRTRPCRSRPSRAPTGASKVAGTCALPAASPSVVAGRVQSVNQEASASANFALAEASPVFGRAVRSDRSRPRTHTRRSRACCGRGLEYRRATLLGFIEQRLGLALRGRVEAQGILQDLTLKALCGLNLADLTGPVRLAVPPGRRTWRRGC
jgi:hypothetical protein